MAYKPLYLEDLLDQLDAAFFATELRPCSASFCSDATAAATSC